MRTAERLEGRDSDEYVLETLRPKGVAWREVEVEVHSMRMQDTCRCGRKRGPELKFVLI